MHPFVRILLLAAAALGLCGSMAFANVGPSITADSGEQTLAAGALAVFSVETGGSGPLSYQWYKDGIALTDTAVLTGSTSDELVISAVATTDFGLYSVVVSSPYGSVTSNVMPLAVTTTANPIPVNPIGGQAGTLQLTSGTGDFDGINSTSKTIYTTPGTTLTGTVTLDADDIDPARGPAPLVYTPSWGDHATSFQTIASSVPAGASTQTATISVTVPTTPGTYALVFGFQWEPAASHVASGTSSQLGADIWNDGNDLAELNIAQIDLALNNGYTIERRLFPTSIVPTGSASQYVPADAIFLFVSGVPGAIVGSPVSAGTAPTAAVLNPSTNKLYVANSGSGDVTVRNGVGGGTKRVSVGANPTALALDPLRNQIYVVNTGDGTVTVIDGSADAVAATIQVGASPAAAAANPLTGRVYVANRGDGVNAGTVSVIDGAAMTVIATVKAGVAPTAVAVNPATNKIYVANAGGGSAESTVTVINGNNNSTTAATTGVQPSAVAVNPVTNLIYVANSGSDEVTVLDGTTDTPIANLGAGLNPQAITVNTETNTIYVVGNGSDSVTAINGATDATTEIDVGPAPTGLAINTFTNKIYVAHASDGELTVIDGVDGSVSGVGELEGESGPSVLAVNPVTNTVFVIYAVSELIYTLDTQLDDTRQTGVGSAPSAVDVNLENGKIYVANSADGTVSVIDSTLGSNTVVPVGSLPAAVAVNPVANQIWVANSGDHSVTVIDGATNATATYQVGNDPKGIAVNPVTNEIFVVNNADNTLTTIDGATNATTTTAVGSSPVAVAVNPATNLVYVANDGDGTISVIDAAGVAATKTVPIPDHPTAIGVDPLRNKIYIADLDALVVVIDGATNNTSVINLGITPIAITVDYVTNTIYVADGNQGLYAVIDGAAMTAENHDVDGAAPIALAADPISQTLSMVTAEGPDADTLTVISPALAPRSALTTFIVPLPNDLTVSGGAVLSLSAENQINPGGIAVQQIYYQLDSTAGVWTPASSGGPTGAALLAGLPPGLHTLYAFATDARDATAINTGACSSPTIGQIAAYTFLAAGSGEIFFQKSAAVAHNTDAMATVTVERNFLAPVSVDYETVSGTAVAGVNFVSTQGTLSFAQGQTSATISVPLISQDFGQGVAFFNIQLMNPSGDASVGSPGSIGIYVLNDFSTDLSLSRLAALTPAAAAAATGSITITLDPAGAQWRLFGELDWRNSGTTATGLVAANYAVEFKPLNGFTTPDMLPVTVTTGNVSPPTVTYQSTQTPSFGSLTVYLSPGGTGGWRLQGETNFRLSGETVLDLNTGSYIVEFEPVTGLATPTSREVIIQTNQTSAITTTYAIADATSGAAPSLVDDFASGDERIAAGVSYTGQIQTDNGFGTGFVPMDRVVVTAAHVLFDDGSLSFVQGVRWFYQHDFGIFEAPPQVPRGSYVLDGYAAQRAEDNTPGVSSPASQQLDAAAMYFLEPAARGGQSGYLASNSSSDAWLTNSDNVLRDKFIAGYPVDNIPPEDDGRLYATPIVQTAFDFVTGNLFKTSAITSYAGNSGGPLFVGYTDPGTGVETFYPAAIYLGGTAQTVVRAIDGEVVVLMSRAEVSANGGANNVGGGFVQVNAGLSGTTQFALGTLDVLLQPPSAVAAGARWAISPATPIRQSGEELSLPAGSYTVSFNSPPGFSAPSAMNFTVKAGQTTIVTGAYTDLPPTITSPATAMAVATQAFSFRVTAAPDPTAFNTPDLGKLPPGLTLNSASGLISGTPTLPGVYSFRLTATNGQGTGATSTLQITVAAPGQLTVSVNGNGTIPKAFASPKVLGVGSIVSITATPGAGALFDSWSSTDPNTGAIEVLWRHPTYVFEMPMDLFLTANFMANPFHTLAGIYDGLLQDSTEAFSHRGAVSLNVTQLGAFTGTVFIGSARYAVHGGFSPEGAFTGDFNGTAGEPSLLLDLQLDVTGGTQALTGVAMAGEVSLTLQGQGSLFTAKSPAPAALGAKAGAKYVLALPHTSDLNSPQGDGFGTVTVSELGAVRFTGTLGDGTAVSEGSNIGQGGQWPFFLLLYANKGAIVGPLTFHLPSGGEPAAIDGTLDWFKPANAALFYPGAFTATLSPKGEALGAAPLAGFSTATLAVSGGGLSQPVNSFSVQINASGTGLVQGTPAFSLKITAATGLFSGKFPDASGKSRAFNGVLLPAAGQAPAAGFGLFKGDEKETGAVEF